MEVPNIMCTEETECDCALDCAGTVLRPVTGFCELTHKPSSTK